MNYKLIASAIDGFQVPGTIGPSYVQWIHVHVHVKRFTHLMKIPLDSACVPSLALISVAVTV